MNMTTIVTPIEATSTTTPIIASVISKQAQDIDMIIWEDGHLSIEHWLYQYGTPALDNSHEHITLTSKQARALYNLLNSPAAKTAMGIA